MRNGCEKLVKKSPSFSSSSSGWFKWSTLSFYGSVVLVVVFGIVIQLLVHKILSESRTKPSIGKDVFSQPPRRQNLVRFPPDVSYFTSNGQQAEPSDTDSSEDTESLVTITTHDALDASTVEKVKARLKPDSENTKTEAHASYKAAQEMMGHGKKKKAQRLLQHAIYLNPLDPDILNAYGEFLMTTDVVLADHMFQQAIIVNPTHSKALSNIKQTASVVQDMDTALYQRIDWKRDKLVHIPETHPGLRRLKKELYYQHIYHTVAIEGNTMNLHQTRAIIETRVAVGGKSIAEHNEIIGMDAAFSYINSTLLNRIGKISLQDILEMHRRVLGFTDPIEGGQLRNTQVYVGDYIPPRPGEVQALMEEFIDWLNSDETADIHPIKLAAIAHYKLVTIHPFYDGNGRTSRLLMNLVLMHAGYPPVMIRVEQKLEYYKYLETANQGDIRPFVRFIAKCTERTVDEYIKILTDQADNHSHDLAQYSYRDDGRTIILGERDSDEEEDII